MPGKDLVPRPAVQPPAVTSVPPWVRDKPERVTAAKWLYRRRHWTVPVLLLFALPALAEVLRLTGTAGYAVIACCVLGLVIIAFGRLKWDRPAEHVYAALSATALALWLLAATGWGLLHTGWLGVPWALVFLGAGVIAWGFFWWRHKRPRGQRKRQKRIAKWDAWWQSHCWHWNLGGSKVIDVWEMAFTKKVRVQGVSGRHSKQHVDQVLHLIESALDGISDVGLVRVETVKGHPNQFDFYFKQENPLKEPVEYDPALAPRSVHEPYAQGKTETGNWKMLKLRCNRFTNGASRTGKSNDLLVGLAALTGCLDDRQVLIDLKGGRSARPVLKAAAVDYVITEVDEARMWLRLSKAEILARSKYAYFDDEEQLHATPDVPAVHTLVDEINGLTAVDGGDAECATLTGDYASKGKGLEFYIWIYTQIGSLEDSVRNNQARGNLDVRTCYRVEEARHGAYTIPEWSKLDASKLEEQGTCYTKDGPHVFAEQVRAPKMPHALLHQITAQNARMIVRPPLVLYCGDQDAGNGQTWQEWWDTRWSRLDEAFHAISPQYQAFAASSPAEAFAARPAPPGPAPSPEPGTGDGAAVAARIAAELDGVPDAAPPKVNLARTMRVQKGYFITSLSAAPPAGISPAQLMEESGMSRAWVHEQLKALMGMGAVTQAGRGRYLPAPGADIREALAMIKDQGERLYREARATVDAA